MTATSSDNVEIEVEPIEDHEKFYVVTLTKVVGVVETLTVPTVETVTKLVNF